MKGIEEAAETFATYDPTNRLLSYGALASSPPHTANQVTASPTGTSWSSQRKFWERTRRKVGMGTAPVSRLSSSASYRISNAPQYPPPVPPSLPPLKNKAPPTQPLRIPNSKREPGTNQQKLTPLRTASLQLQDPCFAQAGRSSRVLLVTESFVPSLVDEVPLLVGEMVRLLDEYPDGWAFIQRQDASDGDKGFVPRRCLQEQVKPVGAFKKGHFGRLTRSSAKHALSAGNNTDPGLHTKTTPLSVIVALNDQSPQPSSYFSPITP